MISGHIHHLSRRLATKEINACDVWHKFMTRIQSDKQAFDNNVYQSALGCSPTNSIVDVLSVDCLSYTRQFPHSSHLCSIPIVLKDNFCVDYRVLPLRTTCASISLNNFKSSYNAAVVSSLLHSGAFILAKTNMDEFAVGCGSVDGATNGPVVNPWSFRSHSASQPLIAGGSSGGSAAAVAAGLCLAALASDTGGSSRLPSAYCGVVGFKPTYGLFSRHGLIPLANGLDVPAVIASTAPDVANILATWLSPACDAARDGDSTCLPISDSQLKRMHNDLLGLATISSDLLQESDHCIRIGIPREYHVPDLESEIALMWDKVAGWLVDSLSCSVESVRLPHTPIATAVYSILCATEVASNMSRYDGLKYGFSNNQDYLNCEGAETQFTETRSTALGYSVRGRILAGNFFLLKSQKNRHLDAARKLWRLIKEDFDKVFKSVDFLLTPVAPGFPLSVNDFTKLDSRTRAASDDVCTVAVNLAGLPAVSFPVGYSSSRGLPISLQLIGPHWSDVGLLTLAARIQQFSDFQPLVDIRKVIDSI